MHSAITPTAATDARHSLSTRSESKMPARWGVG
jgi:hypothetical protein